MRAILGPRNCQRLGTGERQISVLRIIGPKAVWIIIRTAVSVLCPVAESVAIAEGAKYRHTATVLPARAAVHCWVFGPAVVTRYVPVGVRPRGSPPPQLHRGDQGEKEEKGEEEENARGGEGKGHSTWRVVRAFSQRSTFACLGIPLCLLTPMMLCLERFHS